MLIATPVSSRLKLAAVSTQSTTSPVRRFSSVASRANVLVILASDGSSLSSALSASRLADAATYTRQHDHERQRPEDDADAPLGLQVDQSFHAGLVIAGTVYRRAYARSSVEPANSYDSPVALGARASPRLRASRSRR